MDINQPVKFEFDILLNVYGLDKSDKKIYGFMLHTDQDVDSHQNIFLNYMDHIVEGDIIETKIRKALEDDFGITKIHNIDFVESPIDDPEEESTEIFKYQANIEVEYDKEYEKKLGDIFGSWVEIETE